MGMRFASLKTSFYFVFILALHPGLYGQGFSQESAPTPKVLSSEEAFKTWSGLSVSGVLKQPQVLFVPKAINKGDLNGKPNGNKDEQNIVTFGAEKEGSSAKVTLLLGPNAEQFNNMVNSLPIESPDEKRKVFLKEFLQGLVSGKLTQKKVESKEGVTLELSLKEMENQNFATMDLPQLETFFKQWLDKTQGRPFAFLNKKARKDIFHERFPGMVEGSMDPLKKRYDLWIPHFGIAETYIERGSVHHGGRMGGWELNFKKLDSYGEFEKMISWFKDYMGDKDHPFESPGHMWMVFPYHDLSGEQQEVAKDKMFEIFRNIQAYVVLHGIAGNTGIEVNHFKNVQLDEDISTMDTDRGIFRIESDANGEDVGTEDYRFGKNTFAFELRAGTKDPKVQHFVQKVLASRLSTHDWGPIQPASHWSLVPEEGILGQEMSSEGQKRQMEQLADKYDIPLEKFKKFFENFNKALASQENEDGKIMDKGFLVPLWNWQDAPYLQKKMDLIDDITRDFINYVADHPNVTLAKIREAMKSWIRASNIISDLENYLTPQKELKDTDLPHHFFSKTDDMTVDKEKVNKVNANEIDVGIEYSGRFPHKFSMAFTERMEDGKRQWLDTYIGYTPEEREARIKGVAQSLGQKLGNPSDAPITKIVNVNGHGHNLGVSFELRDPQGRKWRVEWDGIGRSYDEQGKVVPNSGRSGHIELVTPKFTPTLKEIQTVFEAFAENNVIPSHKAGGGHVNVDLAPFTGKPRAFARFLSLFHQYRGIISMLFQDIERLKSAEPVRVSKTLAQELRDFKGTEDQLKKLLYEQKYFNPRIGRKTRYIQIDIGSYFQDVIPGNLIHDDFDINNPEILWRPQFRVDPKVRKMEFRLMDAPVNVYESALQMKLVRALLNKAFNSDDELSGKVQNVDYQALVKNPEKAFRELQTMCSDLGLNAEEYEGRLAESLDKTKMILRSAIYRPLEERLLIHPRLVDKTWGKPVPPRKPEEGISSFGRSWKQTDGTTLTPPHSMALEIQQIKKESIKRGLVLRQDYTENLDYYSDCLKRDLHYIPTLSKLDELVKNSAKLDQHLNKNESDNRQAFFTVARKLISDNEMALKSVGKKEVLISALQNIIQSQNGVTVALANVWQKTAREGQIINFYLEILQLNQLYQLNKGKILFQQDDLQQLYLTAKKLVTRYPLDPPPVTPLATPPVKVETLPQSAPSL